MMLPRSKKTLAAVPLDPHRSSSPRRGGHRRHGAFKQWLEDYRKQGGAVPDDPARRNEVLMYVVAFGLDTELVRALVQLVPAATVMTGGYCPLYW